MADTGEKTYLFNGVAKETSIQNVSTKLDSVAKELTLETLSNTVDSLKGQVEALSASAGSNKYTKITSGSTNNEMARSAPVTITGPGRAYMRIKIGNTTSGYKLTVAVDGKDVTDILDMYKAASDTAPWMELYFSN